MVCFGQVSWVSGLILVKVFEKRNSIIAWVNNKPILIVKYGDRFYGMDAVCAHMGCALLTDVNGYVATCPAHLAKYDVRTGEMIEKPSVRPDVPCEYMQVKGSAEDLQGQRNP
ncbi:MAG: Rieske 2Fe-2S domain-containing protein [Caldivirga sp.]